VVRVPVDQIGREIDEAAAIPREKLGMVERVVEQRRQLQPEPIRRHDVLVEAEVYDPRSGPRETPLLRVAELSWCRDRVRRLIEKRVARSAGLGIANLVRPPRAAEKPAQPVQRLPRIPRTGGI